MNNRERYFAAARRQPVDRIPTHFRGSKALARRLMAHFGIDPTDGLAAAEALLACLDADFWASGSRVDAWATFLPTYRGPQPQAPYVPDAAYFYTLGIPAISGGVDALGFEYPAYVDPPLARVARASDIPAGYLTQRLAYFDFDNMINRQAGTPASRGVTAEENVILSSTFRRGGMRPDKQLPCCHAERVASSKLVAANRQRSISSWEFLGSGLTTQSQSRDNSSEGSQRNPPDPSLSHTALAGSDHHVICIGILNNFFMICSYLRGMEQFLMDMALDRALAERLIGEVGEFCLEFNRRYLAAFGARAELYASWDDVAGQNGMMFSPALFRRYFQPYYRELIAEVKRYSLLVSWHCCGSVHQVLPLMIDAGIDIFDVVQTSARDMDLETVYRRYGQDICLSGGIDVQKLLVSGTSEDVRAEVRRAHDLWGTRGGLVLGPSHEAAPETPLENVLAIYAAA